MFDVPILTTALIFRSDDPPPVLYTKKLIIALLHYNKRTPENPVLTDLEDIDKKIEENKSEMNRVIKQINAVFKDMNSY